MVRDFRFPYPIMKCGDTGIEMGVPGHIIDGSAGELVRECSKECEIDSGGV